MTVLENYLYLKIDYMNLYIHYLMGFYFILLIICIVCTFNAANDDYLYKELWRELVFCFKIVMILLALNILMPTKKQLDILYKTPQIGRMQHDKETKE